MAQRPALHMHHDCIVHVMIVSQAEKMTVRLSTLCAAAANYAKDPNECSDHERLLAGLGCSPL